jgi:hypothetical protein
VAPSRESTASNGAVAVDFGGIGPAAA